MSISLSKTRVILFDVDGVLLDSSEAISVFFRVLFQRISGTIPAGAEHESNMHKPLVDTLRRVYPQASEEQIQSWREMSESIDDGSQYLRPVAGVLETLPLLAKQYRFGIVTNRTKASMEEFWHTLPMKEYFSVVACYEDTVEHKPHPEPIHFALQQLDAAPDEAVFIGDAKSDLAAGMAAGVRVIILGSESWSGAWATISSFSELPSLLS